MELLFQRFVLETETDEPIDARERLRTMWLSRRADLGIDAALLAEERTLLERPIGELSEDDLDDLHGRASGALVLLWALGRLDTRPSFATVNELDYVLAEHGILGDGSVARARAASESARLRDGSEIDTALAAYLRTRGKAREVVDPEKIVAAVAAHHLTWILEDSMGFDEDLALD